MTKKTGFGAYTLTVILLFLTFIAQSQSLPDFSKINVDELSNEQIQLLFNRAAALGYSQSDLLDLARQQGLSLADIGKLNNRLTSAQNERAARAESSPVDDRLRKAYSDSLRAVAKRVTDIFGLDYFSKNSVFLTFEPSVNKASPPDYELGAGDVLFIDIYGKSEQYYEAQVNPDGNIILENIGPIRVAGLTMKESRQRLIDQFGTYYTELKGESPKTFLSVSLGQTRSILVSVVGQVSLPGTYSISGFSTVLSALYVSGGINETGTLRNVKLVRNGKLLATVDLYEFLTKGKASNNLLLQDDDVIIVGPYENRVSLQGAVKTPARFELKEDETLGDLLNYAGGFREDAYTTKVNLTRNQNGEKAVADVFEEQYDLFTTQSGDVYQVDQVLERYSNRVIVKGAVYRPGDFAITDGLTVRTLIERAEGLRPDAFQGRAYIVRTNDQLNLETLSFDLSSVMNGIATDILLQSEDVLTIVSSNDLSGEQYVEISGEVNNPGVYAYSQGMSIYDLVLMAQGYKESGTGLRAEVTRRISDETDPDNDLSDVLVADLDRNFNGENDVKLKAFDHVVIRRNPNFEVQQFVAVEGQVNFPGKYGIKNHGERISDLLNRAGGLDPYAFVEGATLIRRTEFYEGNTEREQKIANLERLRNRLLLNGENLTEAEQFLLARVDAELALLADNQEDNQELSDFAKRERLEEILSRNSFLGEVKVKQVEAIGIDLDKIVSNPGSAQDLLLEEGDILIVPRKTETVSLRGKLLYPTTVRYENGKSLKYYINSAGGFDNRAKKGSTYVIYANGKVARTRRFLFFRSFPKVEPGAEIIVPSRPIKPNLGPQEIVAITSGLATVALLISQINF